MSLTEDSNKLFLPGGVQQTRKIAHISQFGPYTTSFKYTFWGEQLLQKESVSKIHFRLK